MQLVDLFADNNSVSGVGTTLVSDDPIELRSQQVDEFAFRLVTPLQPDHASSGHAATLRQFKGRFKQNGRRSVPPAPNRKA